MVITSMVDPATVFDAIIFQDGDGVLLQDGSTLII